MAVERANHAVFELAEQYSCHWRPNSHVIAFHPPLVVAILRSDSHGLQLGRYDHSEAVLFPEDLAA